MTNAEARFNKSLRPRKPEGSLGQTAQDVHVDSHTAPELCCRPSAHTGFNTLDNWGHKTPTQSKRINDRKEKIKGSWPGTCVQYTRLHVLCQVYVRRGVLTLTTSVCAAGVGQTMCTDAHVCVFFRCRSDDVY